MAMGDDGGQTPSRFGRRLLILLAAVAIGLAALFYVVPPAFLSAADGPRLTGYLLVGVAILASLAASRQRLAVIGVQISIWMLIGLALVAGYGYRPELIALAHRVVGELLPSQGQVLDEGAVVFHRAADRHFWIEAMVNDVPIRFMVDTGATAIVLTEADAARLGFTGDRLHFSQLFSTANGITRGAPIRLDQMRIGPLTFNNLPASVNEGRLDQSLLGMRLLERFSSLEISNDTLILRR